MSANVCAKCKCEMKVLRNGVKVIFVHKGNRIDNVRSGDSTFCPICTCEVITGIAAIHMSAHEDGFSDYVLSLLDQKYSSVRFVFENADEREALGNASKELIVTKCLKGMS